MNDPVKIAADKIQPWIFGLGDSSQQARAVLKALHDDGWRIVRTAYEEYPGENVRIEEEWTP